MKFKLLEKLYTIEDSDIDNLGSTLYATYLNLYDRTQFKDKELIYYDLIPKRSVIQNKFLDYPSLSENICAIMDNNIKIYEDTVESDGETIDFQSLINGVEDYCKTYADDYLKGKIEI